MITLKRHHLQGLVLFFSTCILCFFAGKEFRSLHKKDAIFPHPCLSEKKQLSFYFPRLKDTPGDTDVYIFEGQKKGGNILVLGGTHPNEPAGFITSVLLVENICVHRGKILVVPQANGSAFTHNDPHEASPQKFPLETTTGLRWFRFGSRLTNPIHQWPDSTIFINPGGQKLSGPEGRNLNRCYPGREKGLLTEKIAHAIMEMIQRENIDLAVDLHEAAPEYPVINALVFHENSADLAALAFMELQAQNMDFRLEASPQNLRGLSHREWGDGAQIQAILLETANPSQGRLKGKSSVSLIADGKDKNYVKASQLGRLFVPFDQNGIPLSKRVARHISALRVLVSSLEELDPSKAVETEHWPSRDLLLEKGAGFFLRPPE